jgi:hypothetical protein
MINPNFKLSRLNIDSQWKFDMIINQALVALK